MHREFLRGVATTLPIIPGIIPIGLVVGITAADSGLTYLACCLLSLFVYSATGQLVIISFIASSSPLFAVLCITLAANLRFGLFSLLLSRYFYSEAAPRKAIAALLVTDESYAITAGYKAETENCYSYYIGASISLWSVWQVTVSMGFLGIDFQSQPGTLSPLLIVLFVALISQFIKKIQDFFIPLLTFFAFWALEGIPESLYLASGIVLVLIAVTLINLVQHNTND